MLANIIIIKNDENLESYLNRIAEVNYTTLKELLNSYKGENIFETIKNIIHEIDEDIDCKEFILRTTNLSLLPKLFSEEYINKFINRLKNNNTSEYQKFKTLCYIYMNNTGKTCKDCDDIDIEEGSDTIIHLSNNLVGVKVCYKHGASLNCFQGINDTNRYDYKYARFIYEFFKQDIKTIYSDIVNHIYKTLPSLDLKSLVVEDTDYEGFMITEYFDKYESRYKNNSLHLAIIIITVLCFIYKNPSNINLEHNDRYDYLLDKLFNLEELEIIDHKIEKYVVDNYYRKITNGSFDSVNYRRKDYSFDHFRYFLNRDYFYEYSLESEYFNSFHPVELRHTYCDKTFTISPFDFMNGYRCPHCYKDIDDETLYELVSKVFLKDFEFEKIGDDEYMVHEFYYYYNERRLYETYRFTKRQLIQEVFSNNRHYNVIHADRKFLTVDDFEKVYGKGKYPRGKD